MVGASMFAVADPLVFFVARVAAAAAAVWAVPVVAVAAYWGGRAKVHELELWLRGRALGGGAVSAAVMVGEGKEVTGNVDVNILVDRVPSALTGSAGAMAAAGPVDDSDTRWVFVIRGVDKIS